MNNVSQTYKSLDTEEFLDIHFYRKVGYLIAKASEKASITPNTLTIISIFWGVLAGHLFYYENIWINIVGIISLVIANSLDSADGQLARMTNNKTQLGRILDGLAGNFWFVSIYIHFALRLQNEGYGSWIWGFAALTGFFHIFQAAVADYYRNAHLFFIKGVSGSEFDNSAKIIEQYNQLTWKDNFINKLFLANYKNYVKQQEILTKNLQRLVSTVKEHYPNQLPDWLIQSFRNDNKPLMKYTNILTFNTRAIVIFISVLTGHLIWYWIFEIIVLNLIFIYMVIRQEMISKHHLTLVLNAKN